MAAGLGLMIAGTALVGGSQIFSGISSLEAANRTAKLQKDEALFDAYLKQQQVNDLVSTQTTSFAKAGVRLDGSPMQLLQETRRKGRLEVMNIIKAGKFRAKETKRMGRAQFISGALQGIGTLMGGAQQAGQVMGQQQFFGIR